MSQRGMGLLVNGLFWLFVDFVAGALLFWMFPLEQGWSGVPIVVLLILVAAGCLMAIGAGLIMIAED